MANKYWQKIVVANIFVKTLTLRIDRVQIILEGSQKKVCYIWIFYLLSGQCERSSGRIPSV